MYTFSQPEPLSIFKDGERANSVVSTKRTWVNRQNYSLKKTMPWRGAFLSLTLSIGSETPNIRQSTAYSKIVPFFWLLVPGSLSWIGVWFSSMAFFVVCC